MKKRDTSTMVARIADLVDSINLCWDLEKLEYIAMKSLRKRPLPNIKDCLLWTGSKNEMFRLKVVML